jgi:hypothetical protein
MTTRNIMFGTVLNSEKQLEVLFRTPSLLCRPSQKTTLKFGHFMSFHVTKILKKRKINFKYAMGEKSLLYKNTAISGGNLN